MDSNNSFKKIEPTDVEPSAELKKTVLNRVGFNQLLGDLLSLFSINMGKSAKDLLDPRQPKQGLQK